jgi:DNA polymerase
VLPEPVCLVDFETRSYLNVKDCGAWRYNEDDTTEIMCMGWKLGEMSGLWVPGEPFPQEVLDHIEAGGMFEAHNVQFERSAWLFILKAKHGIPMPRRWKDTLAACAYRGLPLALDKAGVAMGLPIQKDARGKYLIQQLCTYKGPTKKEPDRIYREDPDLMWELYDYCVQDVVSEECLSDTVGDLPGPEYRLWILDQKINQRGVLLDIDAVNAALEIIQAVEIHLNGRLKEITNETVERATQRDKMLTWLRNNGLPRLENLKKETLEELLKKDKEGNYVIKGSIPDDTLEALCIRAQLAKASTSKLEKMLITVSRDGRVRGLLQYHGAGTGRWAGRLVQPQNFPRATETNSENAKGKKYLDMELLIEHILHKDPDILDWYYTNPMEAVATSLRGMFISAPGSVFHICDFSAIEARVTFWVANCQTGLDVFAKSDCGQSEDIYCVTASDLVGFEVLKSEHSYERQLGKITVLGCGYQMGWQKLQYQAEKDYGVVLEDHEAQNMVDTYREKYQEVKGLWYGLNDAAIATVKTGQPHSYNSIIYDMVEDEAGLWLTCLLPNGRRLWYYDPVIEKASVPWSDTEKKDSLTYMGRDNKRGGAWSRVRTYGGMLCENVVQAIARDLMAEAMMRVEKCGYNIVLTVHDEIISEDPKDFGSQEQFEKLMAVCPEWAAGCPIAVEGGSVTRYQKV